MQINHPVQASAEAPLLPQPIAARSQNPLGTIKRWAGRVLARLQKGRTEAALMRLSDAALKDIGITRGEISHAASVVAGLAPPPVSASRPGPDVALPRGGGEVHFLSRPQQPSVTSVNDNGMLQSQSIRDARRRS